MYQDNFNVFIAADGDPAATTQDCLLAKKIYGRCKQKECLSPVDRVTVLPTPTNSIKIDSSRFSYSNNSATLQNIAGGTQALAYTAPAAGIASGAPIEFNELVSAYSIDKITTQVNAKVADPNSFSINGCYSISLNYTFSFNLTLLDSNNKPIAINLVDGANTTAITSIPAFTTYAKTLTLEGGSINTGNTVYAFDSGLSANNTYTLENKPNVFVQVIANQLSNKIGNYNPNRRADLVIGLYTIVQLYRNVSICVQTAEIADIPDCVPQDIGDPCALFSSTVFPIDEFNPPTGIDCNK